MQHPLINTGIAIERQRYLRAEGRAAGRRATGLSGWLRGILGRRRAARRRPAQPCLEPRTAS